MVKLILVVPACKVTNINFFKKRVILPRKQLTVLEKSKN